MFDQIEKLKSEYTDKYVVVDDRRPELSRFRGQTGQVKTVNMSGRALVEFDAFNNIGWYDIDPSCLRIVPQPAPKPAEAEEEKKPAEKKGSNATQPNPAPVGENKPAAEKPATTPKASGAAKASTADILAAARAKSAPAEAKPAAAPAAKPSTADILDAAREKTAATAAPAPA